MNDALSVSPMKRADMARALKWAADEGWNPGRDDGAAFLAADPTGFFAARLGRTPIGSISVVKYGGGFAFLGFYIIAPEYRGKGYGKALWDTAIATAKDRTIGLDGVVAQQDNYARSGFELAHHTVRFGGRVRPSARLGPGLVVVDATTADAIMPYDMTFFPEDRRAFLADWLLGARSRKALAAVTGGKVRGYGAIRSCRRGHKIGPLFADNAGIAERLFQGLLTIAGAREIFIDVPGPNRAGTVMAQSAGLSPIFETARMYRGRAPDLPVERIFGITTLELG